VIRASADSCHFPPFLWRAIRGAGVEPTDVLRAAGLPASIQLDAATPLSTPQYFAIWKAIEALADDRCFALRIIEAADCTGHSPGFLAGLYAPNFRDAIARLLHCKNMVSSEELWTREDRGLWTLGRNWPYATEGEPALLTDLSFALIVELGRRGAGHRIRPVRVRYTRESGYHEELSTYYGCPVQFGAPHNTISYESATLDTRFPGYNPEFLELVTRSLRKTFEERSTRGTLGDRVKSAMKRAMRTGRLDIATIASEFGMSERTLQRRITSEATTYRALLIEARRELALQLLDNPHLSIDEIASMLGYQSTPSFYRAFKEWEGVSPGEWRTRNAESDTAVNSISRLANSAASGSAGSDADWNAGRSRWNFMEPVSDRQHRNRAT
jgi:AraC-like DNA-binding protein